MILKTDEMRIDVDKVSYMNQFTSGYGDVVVEGVKICLEWNDYKVLKKAFDWLHQTHMYDKNLKKIR
jgi:hypothetical protein